MNPIMFVLHNIGNQEEIHAEKKLFFKKSHVVYLQSYSVCADVCIKYNYLTNK